MHFVEAKGILSKTNGINLFRGCLHGCIYCDARSDCYQMRHAFEDIEIKENAIGLLENALKRKRAKCMISTGAMTDPYLPLDAALNRTRDALMLAEKYGFGFVLHTKSSRVLRDLDVLTRINRKTKCVVQMTLTTVDEALCKLIEPNVESTAERVETLKILRDEGIPTVVWLCPVLPFINDTVENIEGILSCCAEANVKGVVSFGMGLTLRAGNREYFYSRLDRLFPGLKQRYIETYGDRYEIDSPRSAALNETFHRRCEQLGILHDNDRIFRFCNAYEAKTEEVQTSIFDINQSGF